MIRRMHILVCEQHETHIANVRHVAAEEAHRPVCEPVRSENLVDVPQFTVALERSFHVAKGKHSRGGGPTEPDDWSEGDIDTYILPEPRVISRHLIEHGRCAHRMADVSYFVSPCRLLDKAKHRWYVVLPHLGPAKVPVFHVYTGIERSMSSAILVATEVT